MIKNRLIYICLLYLSLVFVYFYGGKMPYLIFYVTLTLPVVSFLYTLYIYKQFAFEQFTDKSFVIKGDSLNFVVNVYNDSLLMYPYISIKFRGSESLFSQQFQTKNFSLLPLSSKKFAFALECKYRGTYACEIESVYIEDFLGIFRFSCKPKESKYITVYPRVLNLSYFNVGSKSIFESNSFLNGMHEDSSSIRDIRKYVHGDNLKRTHWKLTAKLNDLMVKEYENSSEKSTTLILDLGKNYFSDDENTIIEDKIIEAVIAVVNYCLANSMPINLLFSEDGNINKISAKNSSDFKGIYNTLGKVCFNEEAGIKDIMDIHMQERINNNDLILFTSNLDYRLCDKLHKLRTSGKGVGLVYVSTEEISGVMTYDVNRMLTQLLEIGVLTYKINADDDVQQVLEA